MSKPKTVMNGEWECRLDILMAIQQRLDIMTIAGRRAFIVMLVITLPPGYPHDGKNTDVSELMRRLKEWYTNNGVACHYVAVREQNESELPHYHVILFLDGSKKENGWAVQSRALEIFRRIVGVNWVKVHLCKRYDNSHGLMIRRPSLLSSVDEQIASEASWQAALEWARYLAKTRTKGNAPKGVNEFFCSRV